MISFFCTCSIQLHKKKWADASPIASKRGPKTSYGYSTGLQNKSIKINRMIQLGRERIPLLITSVSSLKGELKRMLNLDQSNTLQLKCDGFTLVPLRCGKVQITERLKLQKIYINKFTHLLKIMQNEFTSDSAKKLTKVQANLNDLSKTFSFILEQLNVPTLETTQYVPSMAYLDGITRECMGKNLDGVKKHAFSIKDYRNLALIEKLSEFVFKLEKEYNAMFVDRKEIDI